VVSHLRECLARRAPDDDVGPSTRGDDALVDFMIPHIAADGLTLWEVHRISRARVGVNVRAPEDTEALLPKTLGKAARTGEQVKYPQSGLAGHNTGSTIVAEVEQGEGDSASPCHQVTSHDPHAEHASTTPGYDDRGS
jgi:hypothetical protein